MRTDTDSADHLRTNSLARTVGLYDADGYATGDSLYFVLANDEHLKIGRTKNMASRMATLQNASAVPLELLMHLPGMGWQEKVWHAAFKHLHSRGEWFDWCDEILRAMEAAKVGDEWIATLTSPFPAERIHSPWSKQVVFLVDTSARSKADFLWRNRIADMEEALTDEFDEADTMGDEEDDEDPGAMRSERGICHNAGRGL